MRHGNVQEKHHTSLTTLLGAMYKEQTKNFIESQRAQSQGQEGSGLQDAPNDPDHAASLAVAQQQSPPQTDDRSQHLSPSGSFATDNPIARKPDVGGAKINRNNDE